MSDKYILFDLDGTLTDPAEGIFNSVYYALEKMGRERPPLSEMPAFIGPPLIEGFATVCGMSEEEGAQARDFFREYYPVKGIFECRMYEGIAPMLSELVSRGYRLVLATSKPEVFARRLLEHFGLSQYFVYAAGSLLDESRSQKQEVIAYAMATLGITDPSACLMVGDRRYDVQGARFCGIETVGVLWGHGSERELEEAGACALAKEPAELVSLIETRLGR